MDRPEDTDALAAINEFLALYLQDQEAERVRPLEEYLLLFPGHEDAVERQYAFLQSPADPEPSEGSFAAVGQRLGHYRVIRELGRGGQGVVYLAQDDRLRRRVALKVLPPAHGLDLDRLSRFQREAQANARLDDPGLCPVHDINLKGPVPWIAFGFVDGETLASQLTRGRQQGEDPPTTHEEVVKCLCLVERAARSLHVAHEAGVVHRDLKPGNLMVRPDGNPVILDFGLARDETLPLTLTLSGDLLGTPAYMAPEQVAAKPRGTDRRTDVYALGAVLYECLTLCQPFDAPTREGLYRAILSQDPPDPRHLNPAVSRDLAVVVATALAKEPAHRYDTALALAEDLRRVRESKPIRAHPAGPLVRTLSWSRRNPALSITLLGIGLVLGVSLAAALDLLHDTSTSLAKVQRHADERTLKYLVRRADTELWPALPETVPEMDRWLAEANAFARRLDDLRTDQEASASSEALLQDGRRLESLLADVRRRRQDAATIAARTVEDHAARWRRTLEAIADAEAHHCYAGLRIEPQVGLVPIGRDPHSGLFEFAHPQTGAIPERDPGTGALRLTEDTGLVFVLLPGGSFRMGARDPNRFREKPAHDVSLDPFFLSKYELTQGQWLRTTGDNPSRWRPGSDARGTITLLHPVENITWRMATDALHRFGLVLPTEAQWEYAARAGTRTRWWTGDEQPSLLGAANLADQSAARAGADWPAIAEWPDLDDGFIEHAPVGTFLPNPFGLHEVHGNVWEMVRDWYELYTLPVRAGDGERQASERRLHAKRGGGFYEAARAARSSYREPFGEDVGTFSLGVRPARAIVSGAGFPAPAGER